MAEERRLRRQADIDHIIRLTGELGMTKEGLKNLSYKIDNLIEKIDNHMALDYCSRCVPNKYFWRLTVAVIIFGIASFIGIEKAMSIIKSILGIVKVL